MRAAIYSPYLDTLGGGEKYMMSIAEVLSQENYEVDVLLDKHLDNIGGKFLKEKLSKRFNLDLIKVNFISAPLGEGSKFFPRLTFFKKYDLLFCLTDGSIFLPSAKANILHIQSPLIGQPASSLTGKVKLKGWDLIIYNSLFTQENSKKNWPLKSEVIYPPVDVDKIKVLKKKKYILSVGRFFGYLKDKKHAILIKSFENLYKNKEIGDWSLHLAGSAGEGDKSYLEELHNLAGNLPIKFYPNIDYADLLNLYGESSIYWHAAGFREEDPTKMEHFGISTVEAMSGGCVPIVISKGGQIEIVKGGKTGFLWQTQDELEEITIKVVEDDKLRLEISKNAQSRAKDFSKEKFKEKILSLKRLLKNK